MHLVPYRHIPKVPYNANSDGIDTFEDSGGNDLSPFRSVINEESYF